MLLQMLVSHAAFEPRVHHFVRQAAHAQLDTGEALRAVDMGPPAENPKAAAFREFWGERAELRRYKVCPLRLSTSGSHSSLLASIF